MGKPSELPRKVMVLIASVFWGDFFPSLGWIDILTGLLQSLKSTGREIDAYMDEVLEEHYKTEKCDDDEHPNKKDFVDIFLQLQKDGMLGFELRHENLKPILLVYFSLSLRVCLFARILGIMEILKRKVKRKNWEDVWLGWEVENFVVGSGCFLPEPTKKFSPQNREKTERRKHEF